MSTSQRSMASLVSTSWPSPAAPMTVIFPVLSSMACSPRRTTT